MNKSLKNLFSFLFVISVAACGLNPHNADLDDNETLPETKTSVYDKAIRNYGMMQKIFDIRRDTASRDDKTDYTLRVMVKNIQDNTGTAGATQYEIPQNVTEMVQSTLNAIGGRILYVPYDPEMMANLANLNYSNFADKKVPDVIMSGGITEFDRGLVTKGESTDFGIDLGKEGGAEFSDQIKASLSSITLDFNLIDFKTQTGIPRMQSIISVKVHKAAREDSIGFTIKSATFGAKGEIKRVQGRHASVRLIIQVSMLQILGRYQKLPYWTLLPGSERDDVVIEEVLNDFYAMSANERIYKVQEYLYLHGYGVNVNGQMDSTTQSALSNFASKHKLAGTDITQEIYLILFETVPVSHEALQRRSTINAMNLSGHTVALPPPTVVQTTSQQIVTPAAPTVGAIQLSTSKTRYRIGEAMVIHYSVDRPLYVRMIVVNSKGEVTTLLPNDYQPSNQLKANIDYTTPPPNSGINLEVGEPLGTDKIYAIASENPIPAEDIKLTSGGDLDLRKMSKYPVHTSVQYTIRAR